MLIMRKCADYVIIILTGHGDFGDKDIHVVHQAKVLCVVCVHKNLLLFFFIYCYCVTAETKLWLSLSATQC